MAQRVACPSRHISEILYMQVHFLHLLFIRKGQSSFYMNCPQSILGGYESVPNFYPLESIKERCAGQHNLSIIEIDVGIGFIIGKGTDKTIGFWQTEGLMQKSS